MNPRITDWRDQRVWVIGASSGIGAALATALLARGARVALTSRRRAPLEALAASAPDRTLVCTADVTQAGRLREAHAAILASWQGVDTVLVVAGNYVPMRAWEVDLEAARELFDVNVMGVLNTVSVVLPDMMAGHRGHIAIVSSVAGYRGLPKALVYGASKAALIHLAEGLYFDLAPKGVAVHVVNPGFVRTPLTHGNDFEMPALIEPEDAAEQTLRGLERGEFEIHYPKRFTCWLKFLRLLPYRWYFPIVHRMTRL